MSGTTRLRQGRDIVNIEGEIYNQLGRRGKKAFDIEKRDDELLSDKKNHRSQ